MSIRDFIRSNCLLSKLSNEPIAADYQGVGLVFVRGFPMTTSGFYTLCLKAVFGGTTRLKVDTWKRLNSEIRVLCDGLDLTIERGREALTAIQAIREAADWNKETASQQMGAMAVVRSGEQVGELLTQWIKGVEDQLHAIRNSSPQPQ